MWRVVVRPGYGWQSKAPMTCGRVNNGSRLHQCTYNPNQWLLKTVLPQLYRPVDFHPKLTPFFHLKSTPPIAVKALLKRLWIGLSQLKVLVTFLLNWLRSVCSGTVRGVSVHCHAMNMNV